MSHTTDMATTMKSVTAIKNACKKLKVQIVQNDTARVYGGATIQGDLVIKLNGPYDVALVKQNDGSYVIRTDYWAGHVAKELGPNCGLLLQKYAIESAIIGAKKAGYMVKGIKKLSNGDEKLILVQM